MAFEDELVELLDSTATLDAKAQRAAILHGVVKLVRRALQQEPDKLRARITALESKAAELYESMLTPAQKEMLDAKRQQVAAAKAAKK